MVIGRRSSRMIEFCSPPPHSSDGEVLTSQGGQSEPARRRLPAAFGCALQVGEYGALAEDNRSSAAVSASGISV